MIYYYRALDANDKLQEGLIEAESFREAGAAIAMMELSAQEIHSASLAELERFGRGKEKKFKQTKKSKEASNKNYYPLLDTLRLYAGWLLAWYILVYALGSYQAMRELPFRVPFVQALLPPYSSIVLSFTLGCFLFLLLTTLHRNFGGGRPKALLLTIGGCVVFAWYRMNV